MNRTKTPTANKEVFPLRLPPETYKKVRKIVQAQKENGNYSYSINEYLTAVIEKELKNTK